MIYFHIKHQFMGQIEDADGSVLGEKAEQFPLAEPPSPRHPSLPIVLTSDCCGTCLLLHGLWRDQADICNARTGPY